MNSNPTRFKFIYNVVSLMVKVEAVKLKPVLIMDQGSFGNQLFRTSPAKAFDEVKNFDAFRRQDKWGRVGERSLSLF